MISNVTTRLERARALLGGAEREHRILARAAHALVTESSIRALASGVIRLPTTVLNSVRGPASCQILVRLRR